jgi:hypothetical protein
MDLTCTAGTAAQIFGLAMALLLSAASAFAPFAARGFRSVTAMRAVGDKIPAVMLDFGECKQTPRPRFSKDTPRAQTPTRRPKP